MDAAAIITAVTDQAGTDASRATVLSVLNERYLEQVAESRWLLETVTVGSTTAGTSVYALPGSPEVVEIVGVKVGSYPWDRIGTDDMDDVLSSTLTTIVTPRGLYAPSYSSSGGLSLQLYPTPEVTGTAITAMAYVLPAALTDSGGSVPVTPTDSHSGLVEGTIARLFSRVDERPDLAQSYEVTFQAWTEKLRRRRNSLLRGRGPFQVGVQGYTF